MRRSVGVVAFALFAGAIALLVLDRPRVAVVERSIPATDPGRKVLPVQAVATAAPPAAAASVAAPRTPLDRFLSGDRLPELFETLRRSTAGEDLYVAKRIEQDCYSDTRSISPVDHAMNGRPVQRFDRIAPGSPEAPDGALAVTDVTPTRAQVDAARELHRRCAAFADRTRDLHAADQAALETRLLRADDPVGLAESIATHRVPATPDRLQAVLASRDPIAITLLDEELSARWQRTLLTPMPTAPSGAPSPVMQLVGCDLGIDCGPASRTALLGCLDQAAACGLDVAAQVTRLALPADRERIADARHRFVDAVARGDFRIWGL